MSGATHDRALTFAFRAAGRMALTALVLAVHAAVAAEAVPHRISESALVAGNQGLYPSTDFRAVRGDCPDCATIPQARWYFSNDLIAVPRLGVGISGMTRGITAQEDVRRWFAGEDDRNVARPPLVWIGSPDLIVNAHLDPRGERLTLADGSGAGFRLTAKIPENRSYYDAKTAAFFSHRPLRVRGRVEQGPNGARAIEARTIWPEDYAIDFARMKLAPLGAGETLDGLVRREVNGAQDRFETRLLWERSPGAARSWGGHAVLGILLNGAQGDDDEAHGGHFAIVTGRFGPGGQWADWMVNNFYNLDSFSEKGIVAAMVPMDNYQMDLNSGQSYYRPSYMLVAVLKSDRVASAYQGAIQRVFNRFYRHDFLYDHATSNCAGISIDTLRSLGWNVPERGPTSYLKAVAAYPYLAVKEGSLESGRKAYAYLKEEQTRLYPFVAFSAIGGDLLRLAGTAPGPAREPGAFEKLLREDVEAILYVRMPQLPSSRAYGTFPVASIDEYMKRVPEDKAKWQIVPVDPRPFPGEFADAEALHSGTSAASTGVMALIVLSGCALIVMAIRRRARRYSPGKAAR